MLGFIEGRVVGGLRPRSIVASLFLYFFMDSRIKTYKNYRHRVF